MALQTRARLLPGVTTIVSNQPSEQRRVLQPHRVITLQREKPRSRAGSRGAPVRGGTLALATFTAAIAACDQATVREDTTGFGQDASPPPASVETGKDPCPDGDRCLQRTGT